MVTILIGGRDSPHGVFDPGLLTGFPSLGAMGSWSGQDQEFPHRRVVVVVVVVVVSAL